MWRHSMTRAASSSTTGFSPEAMDPCLPARRCHSSASSLRTMSKCCSRSSGLTSGAWAHIKTHRYTRDLPEVVDLFRESVGLGFQGRRRMERHRDPVFVFVTPAAHVSFLMLQEINRPV